ncbi:Hypothetical predicted protein [Podarcis lilfordi]|uniref:Uncharacterized protein n=1 Tax=Podarcis lilfordi TaxID=74358 RepID=A0AA35PI95_9SAUR|nr:Hypothetical predicted protein [Podarcis lilfordi]
MWRQGRRCYQQLSLQLGYTKQWPNMGRRDQNGERSDPGVSHGSHHDTKVKKPKACHFSERKNGTLSGNGRPWKKRGGYWKKKRSPKKEKAKHWCASHQWKSRCCRIGRSHRRNRKRKSQRLLAFMHAAVKGRLRPMNLCGWRAPGMRAPRNTTQFIMHQVYQDMRQEEKRAAAEKAAAADKREEEKSEQQQSTGENDCDMVFPNASCMATISAMSPQINIFMGDEEVGEDESSQKNQIYEDIGLESHLSISCEP